MNRQITFLMFTDYLNHSSYIKVSVMEILLIKKPKSLVDGLGSILKNIVSNFLKLLKVSNGDLLFRKVPKNPT